MVVLSLLVRFLLLNLQLSVQCFVYQRVCCLYQCSSCYSIFSCLYSVLCINVCVVFTSAVRVTQYLAVCVVFCVSTFVLSFTSAVRVTQSLAVCVFFCVSTFVFSLLVQFVLLNLQLSVQCFVYQRVLSLLVQFVLLNLQLSVQCFVYQCLCCLY